MPRQPHIANKAGASPQNIVRKSTPRVHAVVPGTGNQRQLALIGRDSHACGYPRGVALVRRKHGGTQAGRLGERAPGPPAALVAPTCMCGARGVVTLPERGSPPPGKPSAIAHPGTAWAAGDHTRARWHCDPPGCMVAPAPGSPGAAEGGLEGVAVVHYACVCRTPLKAPPPCTVTDTRGRGFQDTDIPGGGGGGGKRGPAD